MLIQKPLYLAFLLCFSFSILSAQEFSISGKVLDNNRQPMSFVNVLVFAENGTTLIKGSSTDDDGAYLIDGLAQGNYIVQFSFIGFKEITKNIVLDKNLVIEDIQLEESAESLNEVEIVAKKPTVKRSADRLTFNIANTALSQGDMLQALRSTPGVLVMDGNLMVKGSSPTVYINNRRVQLSANELSQLLESSPANSVRSIEVITNPSARFDAESGTVINIVMSKNLVTGYRGSVFSNFTQGVFPRYQAGTSHSVKNKDISLTTNYSYSKSKINRSSNDQINYFNAEGNGVDQVWNSNINRNTWSETHNLSLNLDWFISDKSTLSISNSTLYLPYFKYRIKNRTGITDIGSSPLSSFNSDNLTRDEKHNIGFDLNFNHDFEGGSSLTLNGHFTTYDYDRRQEVLSDFFDANGQFLNDSAFRTFSDQETKIISSNADYRTPLNDNSVFEAGIKYSNVNTQSDISQFDIDLISGSASLDFQNTDAFNYDEYVYAAYSNYSLDADKWSINVGLRMEQTNISAKSISTNSLNSQDYLEWFPNASIQHNVSDSFSIYANYKRSLTRPNYTSLNPFNFFLNENTLVTGNPNLVPTFLDHYVIGTSFLDLFTIEAYYQNYDGNILEIPRQNNETNTLEYTSVNIDKTVDFGFDFAVDYYPTDNWNIYFVTSFYNFSEETKINDAFVEIDRWSNYSVLTNALSLLKDNSLNINVDLTWVGKNVQGLQTIEDRLFSSIAISKSMLNKKAVLSLAIEDAFNFQDEEYGTRYLNQFSSNNVDIDNRYVRLGFRYNFGNTKLDTNQRNISKEERDRLAGGQN
ncbi:TonB-dependent receptor [Winogradskyella sp. 3972H.M.0a.05]|uniref:TonB-dependent receptor domain-containing protein n=1 Tax=Winogradskyella sp. 3972H.M.0a.05 TaxID=2950277 RepID=UPI003392285F